MDQTKNEEKENIKIDENAKAEDEKYLNVFNLNQEQLDAVKENAIV